MRGSGSSWVCGVVAVGLAIALGLASRDVESPKMANPQAGQLASERPGLWFWRARAERSAGGFGAVAEATGVLSAILLPAGASAEPIEVGGAAPDLGSIASLPLFQVGLNLSGVRQEHAEEFIDGRLNEAWREIGLANAREVVVVVGRAMDPLRPLVVEVLVSYRSRPVGEWVRVPMSMAGPRLPAARSTGGGGGGASSNPEQGAREAWIEPRWASWLETCLKFRRATLAEEARPAFDSAVQQWRSANGTMLRGVFSALEGPIVVADVDAMPAVLAGISSRADAGVLAEALARLVEPLSVEEEGPTFDPASGTGFVRVSALSGSTFEALAWTVVERRSRRWLLVARGSDLEAVRAGLGRIP